MISTKLRKITLSTVTATMLASGVLPSISNASSVNNDYPTTNVEEGQIELSFEEQEAIFENVPSLERMTPEQREFFEERLAMYTAKMPRTESLQTQVSIRELFSEKQGRWLGLYLPTYGTGIAITLALDLAVFGVGIGSLNAYIKKVGVKQAEKMFTKTVASKLTAWGAPKLANGLTVGVMYAIAYMDVGGRIAIWLDKNDYKGENKQINF